MIYLESLSVFYPEGKVGVKDISFEIKEGEVVGILGRSGAGKTTILKAFFRLLPARTEVRGRIIWQERNLLEIKERDFYFLRGRVFGLLPQNAQAVLNPFLRVESLLEETIRTHRRLNRAQTRREIETLLELVGIEPSWQKAYPSQLSGGMKTRIALASLIASGARYLFLDEPTTGLDVVSQQNLVRLLKKIQKEKELTLLILSHNLPFLFQLCKKILLIDQGRVVEELTPSCFYFQSELGKRFLQTALGEKEK